MKPAIALSNPVEQCVTFYWDETPGTYLGYRFIEGQPELSDQPATGHDRQPAAPVASPPPVPGGSYEPPASLAWNRAWQSAYQEQNRLAAVQLSFRLSPDGTAYALSQEQEGAIQRELFFQPFDQGMRMWLRLTSRQAIRGVYCLQQCLRCTGMYNAEWRQAIAHTPFLSELDMQAMGNANGTLTYARRDGGWLGFPVQHVVYPTHVEMPDAAVIPGGRVDHGLIVRESPRRSSAPQAYWQRVAPDSTWEQIACGMYWERTVSISNRHPADCLHANIDLGPLEAGESRTVQGAIYYIEGSKDDLLEMWRKDFSSSG